MTSDYGSRLDVDMTTDKFSTLTECKCPPEVDTLEFAAWCTSCQRRRLPVGCKFDTRYESGCRVTRTVDNYGEFLALDSDGVECAYTVSMVVATGLPY